MTSSALPRSTACGGPLSRRGFMQIGLTGFVNLSWPGLLRLRAETAAAAGSRKDGRDHGLVAGGMFASRHLRSETGHRQRISRSVRHDLDQRARNASHGAAAVAGQNRRQVHHPAFHDPQAGGHPAGSMQMLSGDTDVADKPQSAAARLDVGGRLSASQGTSPRQSAAELRRRQSGHRIQRTGLRGSRLFALCDHGRSEPARFRGAQRRLGRSCRGSAVERPRRAAAESRQLGTQIRPRRRAGGLGSVRNAGDDLADQSRRHAMPSI